MSKHRGERRQVAYPVVVAGIVTAALAILVCMFFFVDAFVK